jgi:2-oxoglutarate ferredoxin oxidoreductase subunit beta
VEVVDAAAVPESELLIHDPAAAEPSQAFALSRLTQATCGATPIGIFRAVERPVYDELMAEQLETARAQKGDGDLEKLLHAGDTWNIA